MTRTVTVFIDRSYGSWPYRARTVMRGAPKTIHGPKDTFTAGGPTEADAIANLKRIVIENYGEVIEPDDYLKTVEVDW